MAWFTVQYRDKSGAKAETEFEATGRAELFNILKERKIQAIGITQGRSVKKSRHHQRGKTGKKPLAIVLVFVGFFCAAVFIAVLLNGRREKALERQSIDGGGQITNKTDRPKTKTAPSGLTVKKEEKKEVEKWFGVPIDHRKVVTNGQYVTETIYTTDGKSHRYDRSLAPKVFDNIADQTLAMMTSRSAEMGGAPLPMPVNFGKEFAAALRHEIVINADDTEEVKDAKRRVIEARKVIADLVDSGANPDEIIQEERRMLQKNADYRMQSVVALRQLIDEGDMELAKEFCDKVNERLDEMGIMKIKFPEGKKHLRTEPERKSDHDSP